METNLNKKALQSISGGLHMLIESKTNNLSALAEIALILGSERIKDFYQLDENLNSFLSSIHFLLKDLDQESVLMACNHIDNCMESNTNNINYKMQYDEAMKELAAIKKELLKYKKHA